MRRFGFSPLAGFLGWRSAFLPRDLLAGLALAALAVPSHLATARLGGLPPQTGFLALAAGAAGFALFGANRRLSVGADSTIAPIFAGVLGALALGGSPQYQSLAAVLAAMVGVLLLAVSLLRLGFLADLLSGPVVAGFMAGVAGHILVSQAPALLAVPDPGGRMVERLAALAAALPRAHWLPLAMGLGVAAVAFLTSVVDRRAPGALIAIVGASLLAHAFDLPAHGLEMLSAAPKPSPNLRWALVAPDEVLAMTGLAFVVAVVIMAQTSATVRSEAAAPNAADGAAPHGPDPDMDGCFRGMGAANILSGLIGAFPLNASPPSTSVLIGAGAVSQWAALTAAALALALAFFGGGLLELAPQAALSGVLVYVALRVVRFAEMRDIARRSRPEFGLMTMTALAVFLMPIQQGVALGVILSLVYGLWASTRAAPVEFARAPGTSIWWPKSALRNGETLPGVRVIGLQAPLSFVNCWRLRTEILGLVGPQARLVVLDAHSIVEIDYTSAQMLAGLVADVRAAGADFALARLQSLRAQQSLVRQGLFDIVGRDHAFMSVEEAVRALAPTEGPA